MRGIFVVWLFTLVGGINNVLIAYHQEYQLYKNPLVIVVSAISVYLATTALLAFITFDRRLRYEWRAGLLLFILYVLGAVGLALASLSGDGRIFLFAFIILAAIFFDFWISLVALGTSVATYVIVGWLQVTGILVVPSIRQVLARDAGAWFSGGLVLLLLSIAALISTTYLLQALGRSLNESRETLAREQHLSRTLRTVSDVNQLIVREQDPGKLLSEACQLLVSARGYSFACVGMFGADDNTTKVVARAGGATGVEQFIINIGQEGAQDPACVEKAIRTRRYFLVSPVNDNDVCAVCAYHAGCPARAVIVLPLLREESAFGVLAIDHVLPAPAFDDEEIHLLQGLTDNLVYALGSLEANKRLQTYARHQSLLNEITRTALEASDLETMLQVLVRRLEGALNADEYYVTLLQNFHGAPVYIASSDSLKSIIQAGRPKPGDKVLSQSILERGQALVIEDIMKTPFISPHIAALLPARSALGLPLIANNQKLGTLVFGFQQAHHFTPEEIELGEQASRQIALAILKARLEMETRSKATELGKLYAASQDMAASMIDPPALLQVLIHHMTEALEATSGYISVVDLAGATQSTLAEYWSEQASASERRHDIGRVHSLDDYPALRSAVTTGQVVVLQDDDDGCSDMERRQFATCGVRAIMFVPIMAHGKLFGAVEIREGRRKREFTLNEINLVSSLASHAAGVIENANLFSELTRRENYFRALFENSAEGVAILNADGIFTYLTPQEEKLLGYDHSRVVGRYAFTIVHPDDLARAKSAFAESIQSPGQVIDVECRVRHVDHTWRHLEISLKNLLDSPSVKGVVANFRDITERKLAEENLRRHAHELEILAAASTALRTAQKVTEMIPILVQHAIRAVNGTYGSIFLLDPEQGDYVSRGWYSADGVPAYPLPDETILHHRIGEGITGRVAQAGELYVTEDVHQDPSAYILEAEKERLQDAHGGVSLPLRAEEQVIGVMHVWMKDRHIFTEMEIRLLIALAETAGNSIHRAMLFEQTLRQAEDLIRAYDNTLAGWARALELRDELTEGHTRRVTELTVQLARALGVPENDLDHIRRGALLHDIGKMGIPDSILHKPAPLTAHEKKIMQLHPQYAYEMLSLISFLRPSLDIPYCHHERWEGSGYPRGLKGEQIPLAARIFAVVDVWDALTSDRPYRAAWEPQKVREYIQHESGKHFDPRIVETFLQMDLESWLTDQRPS